MLVEQDPRLCAAAEAAAARLGVAARVTVRQGDAASLAAPIAAGATVLMNPPWGWQTRWADRPFLLRA